MDSGQNGHGGAGAVVIVIKSAHGLDEEKQTLLGVLVITKQGALPGDAVIHAATPVFLPAWAGTDIMANEPLQSGPLAQILEPGDGRAERGWTIGNSAHFHPDRRIGQHIQAQAARAAIENLVLRVNSCVADAPRVSRTK